MDRTRDLFVNICWTFRNSVTLIISSEGYVGAVSFMEMRQANVP